MRYSTAASRSWTRRPTGAVPVPVDDQGIQTSRLAGLEAGAVLLSPAHSYPSGVVLSADRRVQLLEWARTAGAFVIEDDYDAELRYDRLPVGALQGLDPQRVIYGGSVSKVLSPALRLGWIIAPPQLIDDIIGVKFLEDFAAEPLGQLTLARFIDGGALARHLRRVRQQPVRFLLPHVLAQRPTHRCGSARVRRDFSVLVSAPCRSERQT
jgi:GntR family transcriptional regulator/MocR family aminotransferase